MDKIEFKQFCTLVKKSANLEELMVKFNKQVYTPSIDMSCMNYEVYIHTGSGKIDDSIDSIRIHFCADKNKQHHIKFGFQCGITSNIILPVRSIFNGLTPLSRISSAVGISDIDNYSVKTDIYGYYYSDISPDEGTVYDEHDTDGASIVMGTTIEACGDDYVCWNITSSTRTHSFCLYWKYEEYLKFYSHIIKMIVDNLDDELLSKFNIKGE